MLLIAGLVGDAAWRRTGPPADGFVSRINLNLGRRRVQNGRRLLSPDQSDHRVGAASLGSVGSIRRAGEC